MRKVEEELRFMDVIKENMTSVGVREDQEHRVGWRQKIGCGDP